VPVTPLLTSVFTDRHTQRWRLACLSEHVGLVAEVSDDLEFASKRLDVSGQGSTSLRPNWPFSIRETRA
jgi:hypothetical protein